jgi:hypothetical protein
VLKKSQVDAATSGYIPYSDRNNLMVAEDVARLLRPDLPLEKGVSWTREKCRRRCSSALPVRNIGRHLIFDWVLISEWIRNTPRPIHAPHRRRKKLAKAA